MATTAENRTAQSLRICLFSALYRPSMGGVETYTESLARALYEMGAEVTVATCNTHGLAAREREDGVNVVRFPCKPLLGGRFPLVKNDEEAKRLWKHLEDEHFDYVIANTRFYTLTERALAACRKANEK